MRLRLNRRLLLMHAGASLAALLSCCLCGCFPTSDYETSLPNGYRLVRMYSRTVGLCNADGEAVVAPHVDGYSVCPGVIVGHVSRHSDPYWKSVPGYFVVNMKTAEAHQGLTHKQWLKRLRKHGIRSAPTLKRTRD